MGRQVIGSRARAGLGLLAALVLLGACGSGGTTTTGYFYQAIGPAGGVAAAGDVHLTIPAGALAQETGVGVLPEPGGFPLVPDGQDPCTYDYLGPIWCCGPVGQALAVDGVLRLAYDEALIPAGSDESDLVLLIWDNLAAVMRPELGPDVTHDTVGNFFLYDAYPELGHVAVGVRSCVGDILVQDAIGGQGGGKPSPDGSTQGTNFGPSLWLVDPSESQPPQTVETFGLQFDEFLASPSGTRVLLRTADIEPDEVALALYTVPLGVPGTWARVAYDDPDAGRYLYPYDPLFGWLRGASGDEVFFTTRFYPLVQMSPTTSIVDMLEIWRRVGDASADAELMHSRDGTNSDVEDLRQSQDDTALMVRAHDYNLWLSTTAVVPSPAGDPPLSDGAIPSVYDWPSPQFVPPAHDELYFISDYDTVSFVERDGDPVGTYVVEDPFKLGISLTHFAIAPDGLGWAAVVDVGGALDLRTGAVANETQLWFGTFLDGMIAYHSFYGFYTPLELVWHPQGTGVFLDLQYYGAAHYSLQTDDGDYVLEDLLPVFDLTFVDVNRVDGRIALVVTSEYEDELRVGGGSPAGSSVGLWVSPAYPIEFVQVDTEGIQDPVNARWVQSWRNQSGMFNSRVR